VTALRAGIKDVLWGSVWVAVRGAFAARFEEGAEPAGRAFPGEVAEADVDMPLEEAFAGGSAKFSTKALRTFHKIFPLQIIDLKEVSWLCNCAHFRRR
jgi:hypothetical protein